MGRFTAFTASTLAEAIATELAAGDEEFALRMLLRGIADLRDLLQEHDDEALSNFLSPPPPTGSQRWDTLLAVSVGRELRRAQHPRPAWTTPAALSSWWFPLDPPPVLFARILQRTPPDLACLGIWIDEKAFSIA